MRQDILSDFNQFQTYITSLCSNKNSLSDVVSELSDVGFKKIELTGDIAYEPDIETKLFELKERHGLDLCIHNYFPPQPTEFVFNLASTDPAVKTQCRALMDQAIRISLKLGESLFTCHPGFRHNLLPKQHNCFFIKSDSEECSQDAFYSSVDEIVSTILPKNFKLAVENLSPKSSNDRYSFLVSDCELEHFLNYYKKEERVGILLDLGHLEVAAFHCGFNYAKTLEMIIRDHAAKIFEIHISENDGRHDAHRVTSPKSWQLDFIQNNREILKHARIVFEWHNAPHATAFRRYTVICDRLA
jgi:sugar phosphate isomerase/epimerase